MARFVSRNSSAGLIFAASNVTDLVNVKTLERRVSKLVVKQKRLVGILVKSSAMHPRHAARTHLVKTKCLSRVTANI